MLRRPKGTSPEARLRSNLEMGIRRDLRTGCWIWQRGRDTKGYPRVRFGTRTLYAYRASILIYRNIALDAKVNCRIGCGNRLCINPDHISVTPKDDQ